MALISRHGTPETSGYAIRHEGPMGVLGDKCLRQDNLQPVERVPRGILQDARGQKTLSFAVSNAWFGFTDTYWAGDPDPGDQAAGPGCISPAA